MSTKAYPVILALVFLAVGVGVTGCPSSSTMVKASFSAAPVTTGETFEIQFSDTSTANGEDIIGWVWDFGDPGSGDSNTSLNRNPRHTYPAAGTYQVSLTVETVDASDSITKAVVVSSDGGPGDQEGSGEGENHAPSLSSVAGKTLYETQTLDFTVVAQDADGDELTFVGSNLPAGASVDSATGRFQWTPSYTDAGVYSNITITATDDGTPPLSASVTFSVTVLNANRAPVISPIGSKTVYEGDLLEFTVEASDPDGDSVSFTATNLPERASFTASTRTFSWRPGQEDAGEYQNIVFTATDTGRPSKQSTELISIVVVDAEGAVRINELVALNSTGVADANGDHEDWFELYNTRSESISLAGWTMTDDPATPTKWTFPSNATIAANGYLVLYASGKDAVLDGGEIHTNFRLNPAGEYLGLYAPQATTATAEFSPLFPRQYNDVAYAWFDDSEEYAYTIEATPGAANVYSAMVSPDKTVVINEFLASNSSYWPDEDGAYPDWIELCNVGDVAVDIAGWGLTDDPDLPYKWTLPAVTLAPDQFLMVFASGKDRKPADGNLHTNFSLRRSGEYLALYTPAPGPAATEFSDFPPQEPDKSYGLSSLGGYAYFTTPTPNAANTGSMTLAPPTFSHQRGFYDGSFSLTMTTDTAGAVVRYTDDGTVPTEGSTIASGPITVRESAVYRARVFSAGFEPSTIVTQTYILDAPDAFFSMPVVALGLDEEKAFYGDDGIMAVRGSYYLDKGNPDSIKWQYPWPPLPAPAGVANHFLRYPPDYTAPAGAHGPWERATSVEFFAPGDAGSAQADCGIRIHGGDSIRGKYLVMDGRAPTHPFNAVKTGDDWMYHFAYRKSFKLYFRSFYGVGNLDYNLFPGYDTHVFDALVLRGGHNDWFNPFVRDEFARRLQGDCQADTGHPHAHGEMVNLFINGVWKGFYNLTEHLNADYFQNWYGSDYEWDVITHDYPYSGDVRDGDAQAFEAMRSYAIAKNYTETAKRLDIVQFIDYLIVQLYIGNYDWLHTNWIAARERSSTGKFTFYVWDAEKALRNAPGSDGDIDYNGFIQNGGGRGGLNGQSGDASAPIAQIYGGLKNNSTFKTLFRQRMDKHFGTGGALSQANLRTRFTELYDELHEMVEYCRDEVDSPYLAEQSPNGQMETFIRDTWIPQREAIFLDIVEQEGF